MILEKKTRSTRTAKTPLVSVIVPVYNVEQFIAKCFDSILAQTYPSIELVVVNNRSQGQIRQIFARYTKKFANSQLVDLPENGGLFRARIAGVKASHGDYIVFVDGDDYIAPDYIRLLTRRAVQEHADIVMSNTVLEEENGRRFIYNLANELPFETLADNDIFANFMAQRGKNYMWQIVHSKLFSRSVWRESLKFLDQIDEHIVMTEDVLNSFVIWSLAHKVARATTANYFYVQHGSSSTKNFTEETFSKNINNVITVFHYAEEWLRANDKFDEYKMDFNYWCDLYTKIWVGNVRQNMIDNRTRVLLIARLETGLAKDDDYNKISTDDFYRVQTEFNNGLDELKNKIARAKVVSFDIFDTLILRPFLTPTTLFYLMDQDFRGNGSLSVFHDLRIAAERSMRQKISREDITLDEIYNEIVEHYGVDAKLATRLQARELELEQRYCMARRTGRELYEFARDLGKRIIITSDMYLPKDIVEKILVSNGFCDYETLFLSSYVGLAKGSGSLFYYVCKKVSVRPRDMIHVDDNRGVIAMAEKCGLKIGFLPRAGEMLDHYGILSKIFGKHVDYARRFTGIDVTLGLVANKFFDNPFVSFNDSSVFNCSPIMVGYLALGPLMFDLVRWMADDTVARRIDSLVFLARDGYLPKRIFDKYQQALGLHIKTFYLPTSRKAILPMTSTNEAELLSTLQQFSGYAPTVSAAIVKSFDAVLKPGSSEIALKNWAAAKGQRGLSAVEATRAIDPLMDYSRVSKLRQNFVNTYSSMFTGRAAVFDIGYSGKPAVVFSSLFHKNIETYFLYTNSDEPMRRLGTSLHAYEHFSKLGIRELLVSSESASCSGYQIIGDVVEPRSAPYEKFYSERFAINQFQNGAANFADDLLNLLSDHLKDLYWPDREVLSLALDDFIDTPTWFDAQLFRHIIHEDEVAIGVIDAYAWYQGIVNPLAATNADALAVKALGLDAPRRRLSRLALYTMFDRKTLKEKLYSKARPAAVALRYPYRLARAIWRTPHNMGRHLKG